MKRALVIGLNFAGSPYELQMCEKDAHNIARRLDLEGYEIKLRLGIYSAADCLNDLAEIQRVSTSKDSFAFFQSSHGSNRYDFSGDEKDKTDELLCYWNGKEIEYIADDDIRAALDEIQAKSKFYVLDTCYSGGMERAAIAFAAKGLTDLRSKSIPYDPKAFQLHYSKSLTRATKAANGKLYCLFASQEDEYSYEDGNGGRFTTALCKAYDAGASMKYKRTIKNIMGQAVKGCAPMQTPVYKIFNGGRNNKVLFI